MPAGQSGKDPGELMSLYSSLYAAFWARGRDLEALKVESQQGHAPDLSSRVQSFFMAWTIHDPPVHSGLGLLTSDATSFAVLTLGLFVQLVCQWIPLGDHINSFASDVLPDPMPCTCSEGTRSLPPTSGILLGISLFPWICLCSAEMPTTSKLSYPEHHGYCTDLSHHSQLKCYSAVLIVLCAWAHWIHSLLNTVVRQTLNNSTWENFPSLMKST